MWRAAKQGFWFAVLWTGSMSVLSGVYLLGMGEPLATGPLCDWLGLTGTYGILGALWLVSPLTGLSFGLAMYFAIP